MLSIVVVEDNPIDLAVLEGYIDRFARAADVAISVCSYTDPASFEYATWYDIAFIDIDLGEDHESGMDLARRLRSTNQGTCIVFVTNMAHYAVLGYAVQAFSYVLKPLSWPVFKRTMDQVMEHLNRSGTVYLQLLSRGGVDVVDARQVFYIETSAGPGRKLAVYTAAGTFGVAQTMRDIEGRLEQLGFFRCHVSFLVNLRFVEGIHGALATVHGRGIPVSRHRKADFMRALARFLGDGVQ